MGSYVRNAEKAAGIDRAVSRDDGRRILGGWVAVKKLFKFIAQHSIAAKLAAMAVAAALFMVLVALTVLFIARGELQAERIERAHAVVDSVWSMADSFKRAAESGSMSEEEA